MVENSYGVKKRYDFIVKAIRSNGVASVLDFGCGTGSALTIPLAKDFPHIQFIGVESDPSSLIEAKKNSSSLKNLSFHEHLPAGKKFEVILASEVLEHIDAYLAVLQKLRDLLDPGGKILLTLPNGYGPFECVSLLESLLRRMKQLATGKKKKTLAISSGQVETLANSPHINFFSWKEILALIRASGFRLDTYRARTFLCGLGLSPFIDSSDFLKEWNAEVANRLNPHWVSGWMFQISKTESLQENFSPSALTDFQNYKRQLNLLNSKGIS
jgi:SAM-dependent methyltransferase